MTLIRTRLYWVLAGSALLLACSSTEEAKDSTALASTAEGRGLCEYKGREDREVTEPSVYGAKYATVRRVYQIDPKGKTGHRILRCRELDSNADGQMDVVRLFDHKGEVLSEESDINHDGKVDVWYQYLDGKVIETRFDRNHDGEVDELRQYARGQLSRITRDSNGDGKMDTWEVYEAGKLRRMGIDLDADGRVDRWDRASASKQSEESSAEPESEE